MASIPFLRSKRKEGATFHQHSNSFMVILWCNPSHGNVCIRVRLDMFSYIPASLLWPQKKIQKSRSGVLCLSLRMFPGHWIEGVQAYFWALNSSAECYTCHLCHPCKGAACKDPVGKGSLQLLQQSSSHDVPLHLFWETDTCPQLKVDWRPP